MRRTAVYKTFIALAAALFSFAAASAQENASSPKPENKKGSIRFTAQIEISGKNEKLSRKRFYLIRGSRQQNADLLKRIAETNVVSSDCYFADLRQKGKKVSDEYVCWLKNNDCESSYCRELKTPEEAFAVPEFAAAYKTGLREYKQPTVALKWLNTNLSDEIRNGYYQQYKATLENLVELAKNSAQEATRAKTGNARKGEGFQSIMTDRLASAYFLDIDVVPPEGKKTETYLISNLLPIVFGDTSYVWTCEIEVDPAKPQSQVTLKTEINKKRCDVITKKLSEVCNVTECGKPADKQAEKQPDGN